ncbi:MAG: UvrB/UvrC motif-containing protein, partial [Tidjanibacter sp.]|nr:UvrB/UvrC motif-containing protein [Tidjanibacter sp.]
QATINESVRRRAKQMAYNEANGIVPTQIKRYTRTTIAGTTSAQTLEPYPLGGGVSVAADVSGVYSAGEREIAIADARRRMEEAAKALDFAQAALWRDRMYELQGKKN